jgi:hypothetical protein
MWSAHINRIDDCGQIEYDTVPSISDPAFSVMMRRVADEIEKYSASRDAYEGEDGMAFDLTVSHRPEQT